MGYSEQGDQKFFGVEPDRYKAYPRDLESDLGIVGLGESLAPFGTQPTTVDTNDILKDGGEARIDDFPSWKRPIAQHFAMARNSARAKLALVDIMDGAARQQAFWHGDNSQLK